MPNGLTVLDGFARLGEDMSWGQRYGADLKVNGNVNMMLRLVSCRDECERHMER